MKPYQKLQRHLTASASGFRPAATNARDIEALERKYRVRLPEDFRDYLVHACPAGHSPDENFTLWWPLERIRNIPDEYPHPIHHEAVARDAATYLFFADYSIWCWAWAIACGDDDNRGRIVMIAGKPDVFVADNFSAFVDGYLADFRNVC